VPVREQYVADVTIIPGTKGHWGTTHVKIRDTTSPVIEGGEEKGKVVYEYDRNYSMMKTFEPFRQLQNGVWRDYALISPQYTRFEVVDLESGTVVAVEPYPTITQEWLDRIDDKHKIDGGWASEYKVGDERAGWGFCPVEFRVFDWRERYTDESPTKTFPFGDEERTMYSDEEINALTGQWALYTGCVWGDDSSWKLRYIDLSRIREGIVTSEEKFGYFPLGTSLDKIDYDAEMDGFTMNLEVTTSRKTGKSYDPGTKWAASHEDFYDEKDET